MSRILKRAYQILLNSYPATTRNERGSVELDTLMQVSEPTQKLPRFGEARAIVVEGIRERVRRNGGTSVNEVVAAGGTLGVLFSFSLQMWWILLMLAKAASMTTGRAESVGVFCAWMAIISALTVWWSMRPSKATLFVWQLTNVIGAVWFHKFLLGHAQRPESMDQVLTGMFLILSMLVLSSVIVLNCWTRMPKVARHRVGAKFAIGAILVPMLAHVNGAVAGWVLVGLLLVSLIDPRMLVGLSIAFLTPGLIMVAVISNYGSPSLATRVTLPGIALGAAALLALRVRVLIRRTLVSIHEA